MIGMTQILLIVGTVGFVATVCALLYGFGGATPHQPQEDDVQPEKTDPGPGPTDTRHHKNVRLAHEILLEHYRGEAERTGDSTSLMLAGRLELVNKLGPQLADLVGAKVVVIPCNGPAVPAAKPVPQPVPKPAAQPEIIEEPTYP